MMEIFPAAVYRRPLLPLAEENVAPLAAELKRLGLIENVESPVEAGSN